MRTRRSPFPNLCDPQHAEALRAFLHVDARGVGHAVSYTELGRLFPVKRPQYLFGVRRLYVELARGREFRYVLLSHDDAGFLRDLAKRRRVTEWHTVYIVNVRTAFQQERARLALESYNGPNCAKHGALPAYPNSLLRVPL